MYEEKYMRFPEGREKAITFSYDDGVKADERLIEIFNKYGVKGTFNLNTKLFDYSEWNGHLNEEQTYKVFCDCGQEIALHGARHAFLNKIPLAEAAKEIVDNRVYLEDKFERIVTGMAYAYGAFNDEVVALLKSLGVSFARTTVSTHSFALPQDWLRLNPTCHHADPELNNLADKFFNTSPSDVEKQREPWLFYVWGHSFEFDKANNWQVIENLCKKAGERSDVWKATGGQIYDYVKAYNSLVFSCDGERVYNPSHLPVWLELRGTIYKIPAGEQIKF
jgi:peptidoglycan/xylan/chitin deacetylase (PgdA/CDA1 family)